MIIQQDFLDHWKTALLTDLLDDPCAPLYVIRLWAHCQSRKTHRFQRVSPNITKAICKAPHDAILFERAMVDAGFIIIENGEIVAHEWDIVNAYLISSWENGKKGGRPKKKTQTKPTGLKRDNPDVTHAKPIREEKRREEKINTKDRSATVYPDDFSEFWEVYPKKKSKLDALKAWKTTASNRPDLSTVMKSVEAQRRSKQWVKDAGEFIPHPASWLRAGSWDDEIQEDKKVVL